MAIVKATTAGVMFGLRKDFAVKAERAWVNEHAEKVWVMKREQAELLGFGDWNLDRQGDKYGKGMIGVHVDFADE